MKAKYIHLALIILIVTSCSSSENNPDTPKALQDKNSEVDFSSYKRGNDNLVNVLYAELAKKTPALNELEEKISRLSDSESDSLQAFNHFNDKNNSYYKNANDMIEQLTDSVLKNRLRVMIEKSQSQYKASIAPDTTLLKQIDSKNANLNDLHIFLKISKTLPIIKKYQLKDRPTNKPIIGHIKEIDKTIILADSVAKK